MHLPGVFELLSFPQIVLCSVNLHFMIQYSVSMFRYYEIKAYCSFGDFSKKHQHRKYLVLKTPYASRELYGSKTI